MQPLTARLRRPFALIGVPATLLGMVAAVAVPLPAPPAGADTPTFNVTCSSTNYPTVVRGSINPPTVNNGDAFTLSGLEVDVTIPSSIVGTFPNGTTLSVQTTMTLDATGATPASQPVTVNFPTTTIVDDTQPLPIIGTPTSTPMFTATGRSVVVTLGPAISAFDITANGSALPPLSCNGPTPEPIIATTALAGAGPFAYIANTASDSLSLIDTTNGVPAGRPIPLGVGPQFLATTPSGASLLITTNSNSVLEFSTSTLTVVKTIPVANPREIAVAPNGATAWITGGAGDNQVIPITISTGAVGAGVTVGGGAAGLAISPDGSTVYVVNQLDGTFTPVDTTTRTAGTPVNTGLSLPANAAVTPDGQNLLITGTAAGGIVAIFNTTTFASSAVPMCQDTPSGSPDRMAISPDGTTAWVGCWNTGTVQALDIASASPGPSVTVGSTSDHVLGMAITPDGTTVLADDDNNTVIPVDTASDTAGTPVPASGPNGNVVAPDQGPVAQLTVTPPASPGGVTTLDASASTLGSSPIASYTFHFGDGSLDLTTPSSSTTHTYASGTFQATVTVTDAAGTSDQQVFTGQDTLRNGGPAGQASASFNFTSSCTTCDVSTQTPSGATIDIAGSGDGTSNTTISAASELGVVGCATKGFNQVGDVTSFTATGFATGTTVTQTIPGAALAARKAKVCFQSTTGAPTFLKKCKATSITACIVNVTVVNTTDLQVVIKVPPGDPRFHTSIAKPLFVPTAFTQNGTVAGTATLTITGKYLTGNPAGSAVPTVLFTGQGGTFVPATSPTAAGTATNATSLTVTIPVGAQTGVFEISWPTSAKQPSGEIATSIASVTVT